MPDNTTFQTTVATPPAGLVVATDDVSSVHFQKIKIDVGGDGASLPLSNSNPLPISDAGGSITVDGTVNATLAGTTLAGQTAVTADYDSGAATATLAMLGLALPGAGGAVAGGTFTNPIRVDPTGTTTQPISDGGGSITVDGSVTVGAALPAGNNNIGDVDANLAAGDNVVGRVKITDGTTVVDVFDYTNANPIAVRLTDTNGDYVSSGAGTEYTEDAASAANPSGGMQIVRRRDTLTASEVSTDGDNIAVNATSKGEVYVKQTDPVPVTQSGTWDEVGINDSGNSITVDAPVATPVFVSLSDGTSAIATLPVSLASVPSHAVTNAGTFVVQENGAVLTALQIIDDWDESDRAKVNPIVGQAGVAAGAGAVGVTVQRVTLASDDPAVVALQVLDNAIAGSEMQVDIVAALPAGTNSIGAVTGAVAHDSAVSGNPFQSAGEARSTDRTAVADADVARIITTLLGKQIVTPHAGPAQSWSYAAASGGITNTTGVTAKAAVASTRNYVTHAQIINGHATVDTDVQIRDGASGTVLWRGFAKAAGGGVSANFDPPLRGTANTLIEVACGTTGSATYFNLQGFIATE